MTDDLVTRLERLEGSPLLGKVLVGSKLGNVVVAEARAEIERLREELNAARAALKGATNE